MRMCTAENIHHRRWRYLDMMQWERPKRDRFMSQPEVHQQWLLLSKTGLHPVLPSVPLQDSEKLICPDSTYCWSQLKIVSISGPFLLEQTSTPLRLILSRAPAAHFYIWHAFNSALPELFSPYAPPLSILYILYLNTTPPRGGPCS